ncbi:MAG: hypothetical protein GY788_02055 [bacterium]|nr:hypothetical protein [bacterium]
MTLAGSERLMMDALADICLRIGGSPDSEIWNPVGRHVELLSDLGVRYEQVIQLDSDKYSDLLPAGAQNMWEHLVPFEGFEVDLADEDVRVATLRGAQRVAVLDSHIMRGNWTGTADPRHCVLLKSADVRCNPTLTVAVNETGVPAVGQPFRFRQWLPAAAYRANFNGESLSELRISFPDEVSADVVAVLFRTDFRSIADEIDKILPEYSKPEFAKANVGELVSGPLFGLITSLHWYIGEALKVSQRAFASELAESDREGFRSWVMTRLRRVDRWDRPLEQFSESLDATLERLGRPQALSRDQLEALTSELSTKLRESRFVFGCLGAVDSSGSILKLPEQLGSEKNGIRRLLKPDQVVVPFTTEREVGTQGKRSGLILMVLGGLLLMTSMFDRSWLPDMIWVLDMPRSSPLESDRLDALREPLVALLLLFPAVLYSQFFQSRPRSRIGSQAQLGTFAVLSLFFAMPILPAALLVTDVSSEVIGALTFGIGLASLVAGAAVLWLFSAPRLGGLRISEALAAVRSRADQVREGAV